MYAPLLRLLHIQGLAPIAKTQIPTTTTAPATHPTNMAPSKSDQNSSNQPAPPGQDQTDQRPTPGANYTEQVEQPVGQEVSIAIMRPWNTTALLTDKMRADFENAARQPLPDASFDDFPNEPKPPPFDPETSTYDWAKPEAFVQEKDSKGNDYKRVNIFIINLK
jgi:hypothetical protein